MSKEMKVKWIDDEVRDKNWLNFCENEKERQFTNDKNFSNNIEKLNIMQNTLLNEKEILEMIDVFCLKTLGDETAFNKFIKSNGWIKSDESVNVQEFYSKLLQISNLNQNIYFFNELRSNDVLNKLGIKNINSINECTNKHTQIFLKEQIVLQRDIPKLKMDVHNDYMLTIKYKNDTFEPRHLCVFRHIRNSIAHNNMYIVDDKYIMFLDYNDKKEITAFLLLTKNTINHWINVILKKNIE